MCARNHGFIITIAFPKPKFPREIKQSDLSPYWVFGIKHQWQLFLNIFTALSPIYQWLFPTLWSVVCSLIRLIHTKVRSQSYTQWQGTIFLKYDLFILNQAQSYLCLQKPVEVLPEELSIWESHRRQPFWITMPLICSDRKQSNEWLSCWLLA